MQSSGAWPRSALAARHAALTVLSGPAGGRGGRRADRLRGPGTPDLLCFDMGGTVVRRLRRAGRPGARDRRGRTVGGRPLALPMVDIHTVGAGGGSIAWLDPGGRPARRAPLGGRRPGPACYGRGGTEPTVTDANLVLGLLDEHTPLAGASRWTARPPSARSARSARSVTTCWRRPRASSASPTPRWSGRCG
jgi:N-methylhydantoinase A/oxoprolinase/acetone carboxylase beta subunit